MKWTMVVPCLFFFACLPGCGGDEGGGEDLGYLPEFTYIPPRVRAAKPQSIGEDPESGLYTVRGEMIVALAEGHTTADLERALPSANVDGEVVGEIPNFGLVQVAFREKTTTAAMAAVQALACVRAAMSNGVQWPVREFNDPLLSDANEENDWGLRVTHAAEAWDRTLGEGIDVAVIDSGCDPAHPDLRERYGYMYSFATRREGQDLGFARAAEHGTHVAGTVAATAGNAEGTAGIAPAARILSLQALYEQRSSDGVEDIVGTAADLIAAINMAIGRGAHVVNMSLGPQYSQEVQQALDDPARRDAALRKILAERNAAMAVYEPILELAARRGVVVVVAAGNNGRPAAWAPLPCSRWTISVGAVDANGESAEFWGPYGTNYHDGSGPRTVDLCAPGKAVWSCRVGGGYVAQQGTSMAAPHVAGAAALLKALDPSASFETVRDVLVQTATPISTQHDIGGRLDVAAAVEEMAKRRDRGQASPRMRPSPPPGGPVLPPEITWSPQPRTITIVIGLGWRRQCWICQLVRYLIDFFLRHALPVGGGRYDAYGRVIDYPRRVAMGPPPNLGGQDRLAYVWGRRAALTSSNMGALETYVVDETDQAVGEAAPPGDAPLPAEFVRQLLTLFGDDPRAVDSSALLSLVKTENACLPGGVMLLGEDSNPNAQRVEDEHLTHVRAFLAREKDGLDALYREAPKGRAPSPFPRSLEPWVRVAQLAHAYIQLAVDGHGRSYELKGRVLLERLWEQPRVYLMSMRTYPTVVPSEEVAAKEAAMGFDWSQVR